MADVSMLLEPEPLRLSHAARALLSEERADKIAMRMESISRFYDQAVFIAGMGRSGTTLLLRLFDDHPAIFLVPVDSLVMTHYLPEYQRTGDLAALQKDLIDRMTADMLYDPAHRQAAQSHMRAVLENLARNGTMTPRAVFRGLLQCVAFWQPTDGKKLWLEKCPENELYLRSIYDNFEKARIIFNIRDPRGVFYSFKQGDASVDPAVVARFWCVRLRALLDFVIERPHLKERIAFVRYEDYVLRPEQSIGKLLRFLGLAPMAEIRPTINGKAWIGNSFDSATNSRGAIDRAKVDTWRQGLSSREINIVTRTAAFEMALVGYEA